MKLVGGIIAGALLVRALFRRKADNDVAQMLRSAPPTTVRDARMDHRCVVAGECDAIGEQMEAPISQTACVGWAVFIRAQGTSQLLASAYRVLPLSVRDDTGRARVDVREADRNKRLRFRFARVTTVNLALPSELPETLRKLFKRFGVYVPPVGLECEECTLRVCDRNAVAGVPRDDPKADPTGRVQADGYRSAKRTLLFGFDTQEFIAVSNEVELLN